MGKAIICHKEIVLSIYEWPFYCYLLWYKYSLYDTCNYSAALYKGVHLTLGLYDKLLFIEFMHTSAVPDKIWAQLSFCFLAVCRTAFGTGFTVPTYDNFKRKIRSYVL